MRRAALVCGTAALLATTAAPGVAQAETCRQRIAIECPRVIVPLDRTGAVKGKVRLYVERLGEDARKSRALLVLAGGPGQAATPLVPALAPPLSKVLNDRDIVFFDQRGTGRSGALRCRAALRRKAEARRLAACARHLGPGRDSYASADSVADIEDVRRALGIERMVLYGTSYGTKVALEYAAAHPEHVEGLVLDSVVREGPRDPSERASITALPRVLRELCASGGCRGLGEDPWRGLGRLERRLARSPLRARHTAGSGRAIFTRVPPGSAVSLYLTSDFSPSSRAEAASLIAAANRGDLAPLTRLLSRLGMLSTYSFARDPLFVATTCADTALPWKRGSTAAQRRAAGLRAIGRASLGGLPPESLKTFGVLDVCASWPAPVRAPLAVNVPDVPALVLGGTADLRTPIEDARAVVRRLPRSRLLVLRGAGHGVLGNTLTDCPGRALLKFLRGRQTKTNCAAKPPIAPYPRVPATLAGVKPLPGVPGLAGRVAAAALETARDVRRDSWLAGRHAGGLRGGWYRNGYRQQLHNVEVVRGVRVSGTVSAAGYWLRVSGPGISGRISAQRRVRGVLGGVRIRARKR